MTPAALESAIDTYARDLSTGDLPAGKYHRLAGARHLKDRARESDPAYPYRFDARAALRFVQFAQLLRHYKGQQWAGQTIRLSPCQMFRLGSVFGWRVKATGLRRFTTAYNELPRKQGKSTESAIVALYCTFFEGEPGAEGYVIATKEAQARIVFEDARRLVLSSGLKTRVTVQTRNMHRPDTFSKLEPLGADSDSTDGLNPHLIIADELHAFKDRKLLDVMESATGARVNPLMYQITTAGDEPVSPGGDQHDYACRILDGALEDAATESFFSCICHADPEDDPWSEATWKKANPHYGGSVNPEDLLKLALKAQHMPSAAAEFKQKRLNLWVNASTPCLSLEGWRKGQSAGGRDAFAASLAHQPCWAGVDLAAKLDLMALSLVFPPHGSRTKWAVLQHLWTPLDTLIARAHRDRAPYDLWVRAGWLQGAAGTVMDQGLIREALRDARARFDLHGIFVDPWHADQLLHALIHEDGFSDQQVLEMPQNYAGRGQGDAQLKADIEAGLVDAAGCPVTTWAVANTVEDLDRNGNIFFTKKKAKGRIDPVTAVCNALAGWRRDRPAAEPQYQLLVFGGRS